MRCKNVGVVMLLVIGAMLTFGLVAKAQTRTVSHGAVTTYTDGSNIEAGNAVTYSVWMRDTVTSTVTQIANRVAGTAHTFDDALLVKGRVYGFWAQTHLATGASSDNSTVYSWTLPLGKAAPPAGWSVN